LFRVHKGGGGGDLQHGKFPRCIKETLVDMRQSHQWLKFVDIKGEKRGIVAASHKQAISTNYFNRKTLKEDVTTNVTFVKNMK
jgi:hypothetical protein